MENKDKIDEILKKIDNKEELTSDDLKILFENDDKNNNLDNWWIIILLLFAFYPQKKEEKNITIYM